MRCILQGCFFVENFTYRSFKCLLSLPIYNRKLRHRTRGVGVAEEDPFQGTRTQFVYVCDDNHIAGICSVHGTAGVRFQKDYFCSGETITVVIVVLFLIRINVN